MLKVENVEVFNFEGAFRGLRNPKDSWHLSDSKWAQPNVCHYPDSDNISKCEDCPCFNDWGEECFDYIGPKDMFLAQLMVGAGTDEAKFMRQIFISMDITAPLYWWKEFDTYKVGTVANSCSTMHKLDSKPITKEMFSWDNIGEVDDTFWETVDIIVAECESLRLLYKKTGDKAYWRALVQLLPNAWMQKRTVTLNYQVARAMYFARHNHKLTEWHTLCDTFENLPYGKELICYVKPKKLDAMSKMLLKELGIPYVDENAKELNYDVIWEVVKEKFGGEE